MPRFFLPRQSLQQRQAILTGENAAHARVLRLKSGDEITVCDGQGMDYRCTIGSFGPEQICLEVQESRPSAAEPRLLASVFLAFAKADKLEHVIQKATELGAYEIVAFPSARCVSRPDARSLPKKLERWQKIAASAAEQSGRGRIPAVSAVGSYEEAVLKASSKAFSAFLYENERRTSLRSRLDRSDYATAAVMTGPEGGFTPAEAALAQEAGMLVCTLGPRILRCETAPLCALSALMFACGELD